MNADFVIIKPRTMEAIHKARRANMLTDETYQRLYQAVLVETACDYCGSPAEKVLCQCCKRTEITHLKSTYSIGHTCQGCNEDLGKND